MGVNSEIDPTFFDLTKVPGKVTVKITAFTADEPRFQTRWEDGSIHPMGFLIADLLKQAVDGVLEWEEPIHKTKLRIPLTQLLEQHDPNTTYLNFTYTFAPDQEFLRKNPGFPDAYEEYLRKSGRTRIRDGSKNADSKVVSSNPDPNTLKRDHSH